MKEKDNLGCLEFTGLKLIGYEDMDWVRLVWVREQWPDLFNMVIILPVP